MTAILFPLEEQINGLESRLPDKLVKIAQEHHRRTNSRPGNKVSTRFHYFQCLLYFENNIENYSEEQRRTA